MLLSTALDLKDLSLFLIPLDYLHRPSELFKDTLALFQDMMNLEYSNLHFKLLRIITLPLDTLVLLSVDLMLHLHPQELIYEM